MPDVSLNWQSKFEINTTPGANPGTFEVLGVGFSNVSMSLNEALYQASYLSDEGYSSTTVTGGQFTFTLTGTRVFGDPAQDFIFSDDVMQYWGTKRETTGRITRRDQSVLEFPLTIAKITDGGGDANAVSAITVEFHANGKPKFTPAPPAP